MTEYEDIEARYVPYHARDDKKLKIIEAYSKVERMIILEGDYIEAARYAHDVAHYTGRSFHQIVAGPKDSIIDIHGFIDLKGEYHSTPVTRACTEGGILAVTAAQYAEGRPLGLLKQIIDTGMFETGSVPGVNPACTHRMPPEMVCDDNFIVAGENRRPVADGFFVVLNIDDSTKLDSKMLDLGGFLRIDDAEERASKPE